MTTDLLSTKIEFYDGICIIVSGTFNRSVFDCIFLMVEETTNKKLENCYKLKINTIPNFG